MLIVLLFHFAPTLNEGESDREETIAQNAKADSTADDTCDHDEDHDGWEERRKRCC